jgi:hypothetical protein
MSPPAILPLEILRRGRGRGQGYSSPEHIAAAGDWAVPILVNTLLRLLANRMSTDSYCVVVLATCGPPGVAAQFADE